MSWPWYALFALPYTRLELPAWGRVLRAAGVFADRRWTSAPTKTIRGKLHHYSMTLDLSDWSDRHAYFLGRYYDLPTQLFLRAALEPGDTLIDVGANIGMLTLLGAKCVGPGGWVYAFEPNPDAIRRLQEEVVKANDLQNVTLYEVGASDAAEQVTLRVLTDHLGSGTFTPVRRKDHHLISRSHRVRVVRADDVLPKKLLGQVTVKIDVEGFECRALRGLVDTLKSRRPAVITEVLPDILKRAGATPADLFDIMTTLGYQPYNLETIRRCLRHRLFLRRLKDANAAIAHNVAWVHPTSEHATRLARWMSRGLPETAAT